MVIYSGALNRRYILFDYSLFDDKLNYKVGVKQSLIELKSENVMILFVAKDADSFITRIPIEIAKKSNIQIVEISTKEELGEICKIDISTAIAVVIKKKIKRKGGLVCQL